MRHDSSSEPPTLVGLTVGSYRLVERLGAGGMGEVYAGEHVRIVRRVAVKFLLPEMTGNRGVVDRFFAEARATSSIRHPGIVEIFDCDVDAEGRAYIVMELLAGESLGERLARDPGFGGAVTRPLVVAQQMASALSAAHASGIIHRDLKPENVFVTEGDGKAAASIAVKILDFGVAKLLVGTEAERSGRVSITIPGTVLGSPSYMSPEQCRDASNVDHRTDIYSLGCILFEMLCGRPPFIANTFAELVAAHLQQDPPSVTELRGETPPGVEALVRRLLAKAPGDRPASMDDVEASIAVLRTAIEARGPEAEKGKGVPAARSSGPPPVAGVRWYRRPLLVAAMVLAAGGAVALTIGRRAAPRDAASTGPEAIGHGPSASRPAEEDRHLVPPKPVESPAGQPMPSATRGAVESHPATSPPTTSPEDGGLMTPAGAEAPVRREAPLSVPRRPLRKSPLPSLSDDARKL